MGDTAPAPSLSWQPSLLADTGPVRRSEIERIPLDGSSWLDHATGWWPGADALFEALLAGLRWHSAERPMYERIVAVPRLTAVVDRDAAVRPAIDPLVETLSRRYGMRLDRVWCNLYRDGRDSVAWHGDRVRLFARNPLVAIVSLGERRRFLVRPRGGGTSRRFDLGHGDLLVMGGACQHHHEHCVPKVARAGPRLSVTFRDADA